MTREDAPVRPTIQQYTLGKILLVWAAAAVPMGVLGWRVAPAVAESSGAPVLARIGVLTVGLVWQGVLVLWLMSQEAGSWRWSELRGRLWLTAPTDPRTDEPRRSLWWWLVPVSLATAAFDLGAKPVVDAWWTSLFPFLAEPSAWSLNQALGTPEARQQLVGAWGTGALYVIQAAFNTFLGEEMLFRGVLLPRMSGVFGKKDWLANGILFGVYHLHQPWGMLSSALHGVFLFAYPTRRFRSTWFGVVAHSGQSVFFSILILLLILGLGGSR